MKAASASFFCWSSVGPVAVFVFMFVVFGLGSSWDDVGSVMMDLS